MKIKIGTVVFIIFATLLTHAQTREPVVKVLTFEEAVKIALENSVRLNQERNNLQLSQVQKTSSIAGIGPNVSATLTATQFNGNSFNANAGRVINGVRDNLSGSINANMNLFSGFNRINSIRQFSSQLESQSYLVHRTSQDVINTVSNQYLQVMLDVELLRIAKENFEVAQKQFDQVKEQVNLGSRAPVDEYNQDAQTKAAELRYVQAEITLNNDKALLSQTLLLDPFEQYDVEKPSWDINSIGLEELKIDELADRAKEHRGDYLSAQKNEESQKYAMRASKGLMMPSLYAFANYGSAYNYQYGIPDSIQLTRTNVVTDPSAPSGYSLQNSVLPGLYGNPEKPRPFSEQFRTNNVYKSYGFQLTIPLFNGYQNKTAYVQRRIQYENSQLTRKNLEFQIRNDVLQAVRNYEGAKKAFAVSSDQLRAAEMAFQLETERYNLGVTNFVEYFNANRVYVQAQTDKAQAEYRLVFQKILLEYAVGTLKTESTP
jgi:outer membrane protein